MSTSFPVSLPIPDQVLAVAQRLDASGHAVWCVGGAVRDNLLNLANNDFDLATSATPQQVMTLFKRTVPVGVEHGTVAVLDDSNTPHEVTTFRKDVTTDGRHAVVAFGVTLEDDLARRDFTINAIAYHPLTHEWKDPFDGQGDLDRQLLRAVGDPAKRFQEDYLRILRLLRFSARFDFTIDPATWAAAKANASGLAHLSAERVRDEWFKGLVTARSAGRLVELWGEVGALGLWVQGCKGAKVQGCKGVIDELQAAGPVVITAWLSDDPIAALKKLKCSNAEIERARRIHAFRDIIPQPRNATVVRRWLAKVGDAALDLVAIAEAEQTSAGLRSAVNAALASGVPLTVADLAVSGDDLMAAGVPKGPKIGETLRRLLDIVLDDPSKNDRETLLALL
ncbi:MAG: hypothetical protein WD934_03875 [Gemmatimonadales bacterium]